MEKTATVREQAATLPASTKMIMSDPAFADGLDDIRAGRPFDPDCRRVPINDDWAYERGRLFGAIAPLNMPLKVDGKLNPKAVRLCEAAFARMYVL